MLRARLPSMSHCPDGAYGLRRRPNEADFSRALLQQDSGLFHESERAAPSRATPLRLNALTRCSELAIARIADVNTRRCPRWNVEIRHPNFGVLASLVACEVDVPLATIDEGLTNAIRVRLAVGIVT